VAGRAAATGRAVALRTAEPAADAPACQAAEPLAGRLTALRATAALRTCLTRVIARNLFAERCRRSAGIARATAAADTAGDRAHRDAGPRQEEAGAKRADAKELEELATRRLAGELCSRYRRQVHLLNEARYRRFGRRALTRLVTRMQSRRTGDAEVGETVARRVVAVVVRPTVALRTTLPADAAGRLQATEPFARGDAPGRAAAALLARLAREADRLAKRSRRPAVVARAAATTDAALNGTERHPGAREEKPGAEGADAEELEELASGRLPGQLASCELRDVHRYCVTPAVIILYSSSFTASTANSGVA
jgi:hypothetical protein